MMRWLIENKMPVFVEGRRNSWTLSGHAWIIDGLMQREAYEETIRNGKLIYRSPDVAYTETFVHCIWGWGGTADGWYDINTLDPSQGPRSMERQDRNHGNIKDDSKDEYDSKLATWCIKDKKSKS
jgi:hypothetical protein